MPGPCAFCGCVTTSERDLVTDAGLLCRFCFSMVPTVLLKRKRAPHPNGDPWLVAARTANWQADHDCVAHDGRRR